ncbi:MAG: hypothetical protein U0263_12045 [Polyangiaceae bacterium]
MTAGAPAARSSRGRAKDGHAAYGEDTLALGERGCGVPYGPDHDFSDHGLRGYLHGVRSELQESKLRLRPVPGKMRKLRRPGRVLGRRHVRESQQGRHVQRMPTSCKALPGYCTGCGCLCEDECGGCF